MSTDNDINGESADTGSCLTADQKLHLIKRNLQVCDARSDIALH